MGGLEVSIAACGHLGTLAAPAPAGDWSLRPVTPLCYAPVMTVPADAGRSKSTSPVPATSLWLLGLAWLFLWALLLFQLQPEWDLNPMYSYGWLVPLLMGYLLWQSWERRPVPSQVAWPAFIWGLGGLLLLAFLPLLWLREANPDWRLLSWIMAIQVIGLSALMLYRLGGGAWLRHFLFPLCFFLVAVPWPSFLEQPLVQGLMRLVAQMTVEFMVWLGIPAEAKGNVIALSNGVVGIDEACSGVRSLQSVVMASLFLGELLRLRIGFRIALFVIGLIAAFLGNLARSSLLVWIAANQGMEAIKDWHDTAGYSVLAVSLMILALFAWAWRDRQVFEPVPVSTVTLASLSFPNWKVPIAIIVWLVFCLGLTELWYRAHESQATQSTPWALRLPEQAPGYRAIELPPTTLEILRADATQAGQWNDGEGRPWTVYFFRWEPGRNAAQLARLHRPDVCLPAAGASILSAQNERLYLADGVEIPFRHYVFLVQGRVMHTFHTLWEDQVSETAEKSDWSARGRLRAALEGRRQLGQQILQIVVPGGYTVEQAQEAFAQQLPGLIQRQAPKL